VLDHDGARRVARERTVDSPGNEGIAERSLPNNSRPTSVSGTSDASSAKPPVASPRLVDQARDHFLLDASHPYVKMEASMTRDRDLFENAQHGATGSDSRSLQRRANEPPGWSSSAGGSFKPTETVPDIRPPRTQKLTWSRLSRDLRRGANLGDVLERVIPLLQGMRGGVMSIGSCRASS
jgi:hypothetical protein